MLDHYHFRVAQQEAKRKRKKLELVLPPKAGQKGWWDEYYTVQRKVRDRTLFA